MSQTEQNQFLQTEISATELAERLKKGEALTLLDVREQFERDFCKIPSAEQVVDLHIPMRQIENRFREIRDLENQHHTVVVYCHSGIRSGMVSGFLRKHGFEKIVNLQGGIDAWSTEVDAKVPRY